MGALVTVQVAAGSAEDGLPWLITFGPLGDEGAWEPVVCGPYERRHALGLAGAVAADDDVLAVVEPMWPKVSVAEIRAEVAASQEWAAADGYAGDPLDGDFAPTAAGESADAPAEAPDGGATGDIPAPDPGEVRAAFARIFGRLPGG
ncbi:hypothetical protein GCM10010124_24430 [Pilimelia terevasa]|uniref:Uncharacterized protein n=1 Tax=Pilimelia terevasa TaxID=53372 RepID=A0A8J3BLE0_9ACTN|nr:hypothetical protein [Pilimelia terevasa]GGK30772.1 hypothetical protein GCM10010124_24430 [Pilimelia terevasa]